MVIADMSYALVKQVHLLTAALSWGLFFVRGVWMIGNSPRLRLRWVRVAPHINGTALLLAALYLASSHGLRPWIVAKGAALVAYIVIGMAALRRGPTRAARIGAWVAAQLVFVYIVAVAVTKKPLPFGA
jgi:uncharacterized membrane protein SirB2